MNDIQRFLRFSVVGTIGFVVDAGVLQLLISLAGLGPILARAISIPVAVVATWLLNRSFTFRSDGPAFVSLLRYIAVSIAGAVVNFVVYTTLVLASPLMAAYPVLPLAVASVVALVVNYLGSKHFAFR